MKLAKKIAFIILLGIFPHITYGQESGSILLKEMENAILLGMEEKVLETGLNLITHHDNNINGEAAYYLLGNYFLGKPDSTHSPLRAYYVFREYNIKYPNGKYSDIVKERIREIENLYRFSGILKEAYQEFLIDYQSFNRKLSFARAFTDSMKTNPYSREESWLMLYSNISGSHAKIFDEITNELISKHEEFELSAYYLKIKTMAENLNENFGSVNFQDNYLINLLSRKKALIEFSNTQNVTDGLHHKFYPAEKYGIDYNSNDRTYTVYLKKNRDSKSTLTMQGAIGKLTSPEVLNKNYKNVYLILSHLSDKYEKNDVINDLHLFLASKFMKVNNDGKYDFITRFHLEYIIQNSISDDSISYLLATEFIENNSFVTPEGIESNPFISNNQSGSN